MPTPLNRVGDPLEDVAPQVGWRLAEAWGGRRIMRPRCGHAPAPGVLGLRQTRATFGSHRGVN